MKKIFILSILKKNIKKWFLIIGYILENYLDPREQKDSLFVAKRFRMFEDALTRAIAEEGAPEGGFE